jgi:hypothetical protein
LIVGLNLIRKQTEKFDFYSLRDMGMKDKGIFDNFVIPSDFLVHKTPEIIIGLTQMRVLEEKAIASDNPEY